MLIFPFIEIQTRNLGKILKPFAMVTLINGTTRRELAMLVDSGADITLFPKIRGTRLGFPPPKKQEVHYLGGIAGEASVVYRTIEMKIGDVQFPCRVAWAQTDNVPSVLGRVDVFDRFDIEFKQKDRKVLFTRRH